MSRIWIAGIDPSLTATGLFVGERIGFGRVDAHVAACCTTAASDDHRLGQIFAFVSEALRGLRGDVKICGVETNYIARGKSPLTALAAREAVAVCILAAEEAGWDVIRVSPSEGKKALGGHGQADKDSMADHAFRLYPGLDKGRPQYWRKAVADAIGVSIAASNKAREAAHA